MTYRENTRDYQKLSELSTVAGYKNNTQIAVAFLYTNKLSDKSRKQSHLQSHLKKLST